MTDEEKLKIFEYFLDKIETPSIKEFTKFCLSNAPDYFFTLPASTSGLNHGKDEKLIDHILGCLALAEKVAFEQFKNHWTVRQQSQLLSAVMLHDCWRAGEIGSESRITQENIDSKGLDQSLLGNLKTSRDHPEVAYRKIIFYGAKYNSLADENKWERISQNNLSVIATAVHYHMGPFYEVKDKPFSLSWPFDTVVVQTHCIDMMNTMSMMYFTRGKIEHK